MLLWIVTYPERERRQNGHRLRLPRPEWFSSRLQRYHVDELSAGSGLHVVGIVRATPGKCYRDCLTCWSKEEEVMFQYLQRCQDSFSFCIEDMCVLETSSPVVSCTTCAVAMRREMHARRIGQQSAYSLRHPVAFPVDDWLECDAAADIWVHRQLRLPHGEHATGMDYMMLQVPSPIAGLIMHGGWKSLVARGDWFAGRNGRVDVDAFARVLGIGAMPEQWPASFWEDLKTARVPGCLIIYIFSKDRTT